jgi:hypothetical protein
MIKAILTKPLNGEPEGTPAEFNKTDFEMLEKLGAVKRAPADGPDPEPELEPELEPEKAPTPAPAKADPVPANKMDISSANKAAKAG